jgi:sulfonate transport system substrate-binding protein
MLTASKDAASRPVAVTSGVIASEQQVANAFSSAKLIPGKVNMSSYSVTTFNNTVPGSS